MNPLKIFITYSWDSDEHKDWVQKLATDLDEYTELHVTCDIFDLDNFSDKNHFMEKAINESDVIVVVSTKKYKQKADERQGGVGIETYLTTIRHWEESENGGSSKIVVASREKYSAPNYLKGKFRVDFHEDDLYSKSLSFLIKSVTQQSRIKRPEKKRSIENITHSYSFTKSEDILKLKYSKRKALINQTDGTDFSAGSRVKFELWEVKTPFTSHILILYPHITISQTIQRVCEAIKNHHSDISELTILRPAKGEESLIRKIINTYNLTIRIAELTYSEFVWEYCIDESLREPPAVHANKFYTDQSLSPLNSDEPKKESAITFLTDKLSTEASSSEQLIIATGGMGKSTLCHELANSLKKKMKNESSVILIKAESLRDNVSPELLSNIEIKSVYDLYDLNANINKLEATYEKNQFELCLLLGRINIIIDGLDEFTTILQERFDLNSFLKSISESHQQMGRSQVLLTSRNISFIEEINLDEYGIECYELLGFDESSRKKYINKRFKTYENSADIISTANTYISQLSNFGDSSNRIIPFFIDIVSTVFEDQIELGEKISFEISDDDKDYQSNSSLTDLIIFSVLRREKLRHEIELETGDIADIFAELAIEHGEIIPTEKLREKLCIYYDEQSDALMSKISINPLFTPEKDILRFRYEFLSGYFKSLFIISGILRKSLSKDMVQCLASSKSTESQVLTDVITYFTTHTNDLHSAIKEILKTAKSRLQQDSIDNKESDSIKRATGTLLSIYAKTSQHNKSELSRQLRDLYQVSSDLEDEGKIERLYIYGNFPPLDFSNLKIWNSGFFNYENFITSKFLNTNFFYSEFSNTGGTYPSESFNSEMFDSTCMLGALADTVAHIKSSESNNKSLCESELKRFLRSFYKGSSFTDQKTLYMNFSDKIEALYKRNFNGLLKLGLIEFLIEKRGEKYYTIAENYHDSVYKFLSNNLIDAKIQAIISSIK